MSCCTIRIEDDVQEPCHQPQPAVVIEGRVDALSLEQEQNQGQEEARTEVDEGEKKRKTRSRRRRRYHPTTTRERSALTVTGRESDMRRSKEKE